MIRALLLCLPLLALAFPARAATLVVPGPVTIVPLDISTVTTGSTPVNAIASGNRTAGGWIANPAGAAGPLCISETAPATVTSSGTTTCIAVGTSYVITPGIGPVSVNSSDSAHVFSGQGAKQ